jgi:hypothetical protein
MTGVVVLRSFSNIDDDGRLGEWFLLRAAHGSDSDIHRVQADPQAVNRSPGPNSVGFISCPTISLIPHSSLLYTVMKGKTKASV